VSIRFKVILPYLLLTLIVAATGAFVVTRLVSSTLAERLKNQLVEAGRVVSDTMAKQEQDHIDAALLISYTRGLGEAVNTGNHVDISRLALPAAARSKIESVLVFDSMGHEFVHAIRQSNGSMLDVTRPRQISTLSIVDDLLKENNPDGLPKRTLAIDPVDGRYYYFTAIPVMFDEQVIGAIAVGTSLNVIMPDLKNTSLADVILYDGSGHAIASTFAAQDALYQTTISIPVEQYRSILANQTVVEGKNIDIDNRPYSLAYGTLKVADDQLAVFAVALSAEFVAEPGNISRRNYVLIYAVAMVAVIAIGYFVSRLIIGPLLKLVRTSRAIAGGDLTKRTEIKSRDEIGMLASSFDEMTDHLQQRTLELEKTNKILEQMDRAKMRFIQIAAHELRTPLTLVQGYAQMVEFKAQQRNEFAKYAEGILEGTGRMVEVIDSMLDVSRIDSNLLEILPVEVELHEVIEKVRESLHAAFVGRNLTFTTENLNLPVIVGDKDLLYKLFYHIIINAIKYTPDGGCITVEARVLDRQVPKAMVEITVKDTGIGIDPQNQQLVFEKFYQTGEVLLHSSGKTKFKGGGPGLGLAIARGIVNAHHGQIWLESPGFDETRNPGTTVFVQLPVNGRSK